MKFTDTGLALLKEFEGCKLKAYEDIRGILTIGYGCTGVGIYPGLVISQARADEMLLERLEDEFIPGVKNIVKVSLNDNQFSALVVLAYNIGLTNLRGSTLIKRLNAKDFAGAAEQFLRWNKAAGNVVSGLTRRREAERALFLTA